MLAVRMRFGYICVAFVLFCSFCPHFVRIKRLLYRIVLFVYCILSEVDGQTAGVESQRIRKHHGRNCEIRKHLGTGCCTNKQVSLFAVYKFNTVVRWHSLNQARRKVSAPHISLFSLPSLGKIFSQSVEIWQSSAKNNSAQFFRDTVYITNMDLLQWMFTCVLFSWMNLTAQAARRTR